MHGAPDEVIGVERRPLWVTAVDSVEQAKMDCGCPQNPAGQGILGAAALVRPISQLPLPVLALGGPR